MNYQKLLGVDEFTKLQSNYTANVKHRGTRKEVDFQPVVKLFLPWATGTWLLTELSTEDEGLCFGLADLGFGTPEIGYISLDELWEVKGPGGLRVERDLHWRATKPLSEYAREAHQLGYIRP